MIRTRSSLAALALSVALLAGCGAGAGEKTLDALDVSLDVQLDGQTDPDAELDEASPDAADLAEPEPEPEPEVEEAEAEPEVIEPDPEPEPDTAEPPPDLVEEEVEPVYCAIDGSACDDEDACTWGDRCQSGTCVGTAYECDDGRECTDDACDGQGACAFTRKSDWCLINGQCVQDGAGLPGNWCIKCDVDSDPLSWTMDTFGTCEDDDPCTIHETCEEGKCRFELKDCDDGNACTTDVCLPGAGCQHSPNFLSCDNGDVCDAEDICIDGACVGGAQALDCDDQNPCTLDTCDPELGCAHEQAIGACEDGDVCTLGDACVEGVCVPGQEVRSCDDSNACTDDSCHPIAGCLHLTKENNICCQGGLSHCDDGNFCSTDLCDPETGECSYELNTLPCDDGDACTAGDHCVEGACISLGPTDCDDDNVCTSDSCDSWAGCLHSSVSGDCDDHDACTSGDHCQNGACVGQATFCNDGEICTHDRCDAVTGECYFPPNTAPCDDANICTSNDHCEAGACTGDQANCDDDDPCSTDLCNPVAGCYHEPYTGPCDDGIDCTFGDACVAGVCVGDDSECTNCPPAFSTVVSKFNALAIGTKGIPGEGLDIDGNPDTCSPAPGCSGGVDNAMSKFAALANAEIDKALQQGDIALLLEHTSWNTNGAPYQMNVYAAKPASDSCDFMVSDCPYWIDVATMTEDCYPMVFFDNMTMSGGTFSAGGPGYIFPFDLPIIEGLVLSVTLFYAQMEGSYTVSGGKVTSMEGILGGAVNKAQISEIINNLPDETWEESPLSKDQIITMLDLLLPTDIDTDGDGTLDGATMGLKFTAIKGHIQGLEP